MADELKPCPFCGGKARVIERPQAGEGTGFFCAISCFCDGYSARAHQHATGETEDAARAEAIAAASIAVLPEMRELILAGRADHHAEPFARHRIDALTQALKIARAAQYSPSPATDTMRGIEGLMAN